MVAQQAPNLQTKAAFPSVEEVLEKYIRALGGRDVLRSVSSRMYKGTRVGLGGGCELIQVYQKAPNKSLFVQNSPCLGSFARFGFNGSVLWFDSPFKDGPEITTDETKMASANLDNDFHLSINFRELYPSAVVTDKVKHKALEAYVVDTPRPDGSVKRWYFDTTTGLLISVSGSNRIIDYLDYKAVDGIQIPFIQREWDRPSLESTLTLTEVKHNVPIDDAMFDPPKEHKRLDPFFTDLEPLMHDRERPFSPGVIPPKLSPGIFDETEETFDNKPKAPPKPVTRTPKKKLRKIRRVPRRRAWFTLAPPYRTAASSRWDAFPSLKQVEACDYHGAPMP
jgi:hypothetical protein